MAETSKDVSSRVMTITRPRRQLYAHSSDTTSLQSRILKESAVPGDAKQTSAQGYFIGQVPRPFDYDEARKFRTQNSHHSSCLAAKIQATIGLGFKGPKRPMTDAEFEGVSIGRIDPEELDEEREDESPIYEQLDPLCDVSFQDVLQDVTEDFVELGTGYFEVVRDKAGVIRGLHHLPAHHVWVYKEDRHNYHFLVQGPGLSWDQDTIDLRFARFGDLERHRAANQVPADVTVSEVIAIRQASSRSRYYGFPDWLACVAPVELVHMHRQHSYDFYNNRGVPEFMLFILGKKLSDPEWNAIEDSVQAGVGQGNSYKSLAVNIEGDPETLHIQLERLGLDSGASAEGTFAEITDALAMDIVSAHRVPPLLAGIMVPGKLGASNELVNALIAFQTLVIGPFQTTLCQALKNSLGDPGKAKELGVDRKDLKLKTILDKFDLKKVDTMSKMRQPMGEAQQQGRDLKAGVKKD